MKSIHEWKELSLRLRRIKAEEAEIRREICESIIGNAEMVNGRVTIKSSQEGYAITAVQTLGYTVDIAVLGNIWEALSTQEQECIQMKPTLIQGKYKALPEESLLHEAIVTRMAMPTLKAENEGI